MALSVGRLVGRSVCLQKICKIFKKRFCEYNIGSIENKSCSTTWLDPKKDFEPYPNPKSSPLGLQKVKNNPKIKSNSKSPNWRNRRKWKLLNNMSRPQISLWTLPRPQKEPIGAQKSKKWPKNEVKFKSQN